MHLIVGGDSDIGMAIADNWNNNNIPFHASTRRISLISGERPYIDLSDVNTIININFAYDVAIITAGVTSIDKCERNPEETRNINVVNTSLLINKLHSQGAYVMFLSSNQVFDGRTNLQKVNDEKSPITQYGGQKSEMEDLVSKLEGYSILRLTKVIHPEFSLFKEWDSKLMKNIEIKAFTDMVFCPVDIDTVISKIDGLLTNKVNGIYHCSGDVDITYYKYAENLGLSVQLDCKEECLNNIDIFTPPRFTCLCEHN